MSREHANIQGRNRTSTTGWMH